MFYVNPLPSHSKSNKKDLDLQLIESHFKIHGINWSTDAVQYYLSNDLHQVYGTPDKRIYTSDMPESSE